MQTFLPYPNFTETAECLDYKRLGKQRVEALQIHNIVSGKRTYGGWINHPIVKMWRGFPNLLAYYHNVMIKEWINRGYKNNMELLPENITCSCPCVDNETPSWLGNNRLHSSHRSNLLRKDPDFYGQYGWSEPSDLDYVWEVK